MIEANKYRYSVSALCRCLGISRGQLYYQRQRQKKVIDNTIMSTLREIFIGSYQAYGARRLKVALAKQRLFLSRRRIAMMMKRAGLESKYKRHRYCVHSLDSNQSTVTNVLQRHFAPGSANRVVVTDLSYVRVKDKWHYLCVFVDLFNRQIVGASVGKHKNTERVIKALSRIPGRLSNIKLFHSDRGKEFDNRLIDECLSTFGIERSLSHKGCPYDNAVAEATFKSIKTEFVQGETFNTITELEFKFSLSVKWFNYHRLHSSLGYQTPVEYKQNRLQ